MALGIVRTIPSNGHVEILVSSGNTRYHSVRILNPNDGVVYVAKDRDCLGVDFGSWDWKIPSQSYGLLPGPFLTAGLFYLDQSGSGRQAEVITYPGLQPVFEPMFLAIGRALQAQATSLDVTEGSQPANPAIGVLRLWADATDDLHLLNSSGADVAVVDSGSDAQSVGGNLTVGGALAVVGGATALNLSTTSGTLTAKGSTSDGTMDALLVRNSINAVMFEVRNDIAIGFLGGGPTPRPNVTGSRGGNAALASLLTALANFGLITDLTTA